MELTNKDIQVFYGCSHVTARARIKEIKEGLSLRKKGRILIHHLAKWEGLTLLECMSELRMIKG